MLLNLFLVLSFITSAFYVYDNSRSIITVFPYTVFVFIVLNVLFVAFLFISSLFLSEDDTKKYDKPWARKIVYYTMEWILDLSRVDFSVNGEDKLPDENFVLISNHRSKYDPIFTYVIFKNRKMAFISKKENMDIPIAGRYIRYAGFLPIDRENALRAMRTVRKAADMIKENGYSMGIYPEGTRNRDKELLPFKEGAFVVAKKANCPIVVTASFNTDEVKQRFPSKTYVNLDVIDVISADDVMNKSPAELSEICYDMIDRHIKCKSDGELSEQRA